MNFLVLLLIPMVISSSEAQYDIECSRKVYNRCLRIADPLVTDPHLIFPSNLPDIEHVCRMWDKFVDCIRAYIDKCFTETRRNQFNSAVESSVESIHEMCTASSYQTEYLQHASCLKSMLTEDSHCGRHYKQLVAQVQGPRDMGRGDLCCSHHRFRECILSETRRICDVKTIVSSKMLPSAFSRQILDKAMGFLREQCSNYVPNQGDCPGYQMSLSREVEIYQSTSPTKSISTQTIETHYLTNDQVFSDNFQPTVNERVTMNPLSWIPSGRDGRRKTTKSTDFGNDYKTTGSFEETSSRSSFGRGMNWDTTDSNGKDDIFKATHYKPSTESWYPGNNINFNGPEKELNDFSSNQVDEPNQQGLAKLDSGAESSHINKLITFIFILISALVIT